MGAGFMVQALGFLVQGLGFRVHVLAFRVEGLGCLGFRVYVGLWTPEQH